MAPVPDRGLEASIVRILLIGPGRAGWSLARRFRTVGHDIVGVASRRTESAAEAAADLGSVAVGLDDTLPAADLMVIAVRDDAIVAVAERLASNAGAVDAAVHLSGLTPVAALDALSSRMPVGAFHPLQTLPNPDAGAERLRGAWVAVTSDDNLFADRLFSVAHALGMHPFELDDECKAVYHAAAAAAANYPVAALAMAERLFGAAGVPLEAAEPLVRAVVDNAFQLSPTAALTGPVARGDAGTVAAQIAAVAELDPALADDFRAMARATARVAGTSSAIEESLA